MTKEIAKLYVPLQKKYGLPGFAAVNKDFAIDDIETESYPLSLIREKITEKIEATIKILQEILQPDTNIANLYEIRFIDDEQKKKVYNNFKMLMKLQRFSQQVSLSNEEEEQAAFIKLVHEEWQLLKKDIVEVLEILKNSWDMDTNIKDDLSYLG